MKDLLPLAEKIGAALKQRKETVAIAESSSGGLIAASLLSVPGASAAFLGVVVYTRESIRNCSASQRKPSKGCVELRNRPRQDPRAITQTLRRNIVKILRFAAHLRRQSQRTRAF